MEVPMKRFKMFLLIFTSLCCIRPGLLSAQTLQLDYSTYLGGSSSDSSYAIVVDSENSVYVTGYSNSSDFPTENPYQESGWGPFVTKFSSSGSSLIYSTYLGGSNPASGTGICLDSGNNVDRKSVV